MTLAALLFVAAILGVAKTADWFLSAAEKIGNYFHLPQFIMGVVLVGFGTSLPELTTSLAAVSSGEAGVTIGNILGSNIANVLVIIGISTLAVGTIRFNKEVVNIDSPLMMATIFFFALTMLDGQLGLIDGVMLLSAFIAYMAYSMFYKDSDEYHSGLARLLKAIFSRRDKDTSKTAKTKLSIWTCVQLVASLAGLALFSKISIDNLLVIVGEIGIAVGVVSFFALALGTSLPELAVSIKALRKGHGDTVIGNIIGSCMFNMLLIGGITSVVMPQTVTLPDGYWMVGGLIISGLLLVIATITKRMHIWEGAAFLFVYVALSSQILRL